MPKIYFQAKKNSTVDIVALGSGSATIYNKSTINGSWIQVSQGNYSTGQSIPTQNLLDYVAVVAAFEVAADMLQSKLFVYGKDPTNPWPVPPPPPPPPPSAPPPPPPPTSQVTSYLYYGTPANQTPSLTAVQDGTVEVFQSTTVNGTYSHRTTLTPSRGDVLALGGLDPFIYLLVNIAVYVEFTNINQFAYVNQGVSINPQNPWPTFPSPP